METQDATNEYAAFRGTLVDFVRSDMVGPSSADELIPEPPVSRYSAAVLFPQENEERLEEQDNAIDEDGTIEQTSSFCPSAMGLSFSVSEECTELETRISAARYVRLKENDYGIIRHPSAEPSQQLMAEPSFAEALYYDKGMLGLRMPIDKELREKLASLSKARKEYSVTDAIYRLHSLFNGGWRRDVENALDRRKVSIDTTPGRHEYPIENQDLKLICSVRERSDGPGRICTIALINTSKAIENQSDDEKAYFQVRTEVSGTGDSPVFLGLNAVHRGYGTDPEDDSIALLYRKKKIFAAGHGTAVEWDSRDDEPPRRIWTEAIPTYKVPQMDFDLPEGLSVEPPDLRMAHLAEGSDEDVVASLEALIASYKDWIDLRRQEMAGLDKHFQIVAEKHMTLCEETAARMKKGVSALTANPKCMRAFKLANRAMLMQRVRTDMQKERSRGKKSDAQEVDYVKSNDKWRPFQIAFLLLNLESVADPESPDRDIVDLIWFPTGGGKTEAYLALTAFTIFLRRMNAEGEAGGGTTVLMRYTLRLLTSQQFQRASTLICACERIRQKEGDLGSEEISIGLWLGFGSTPNTLAQAGARLRELNTSRYRDVKNPFQVLNCPWCGAHMTRKEGQREYCYRIPSSAQGFVMWCPDERCAFKDRLPIRVVDDDIYRQPPTLLFGTVDKFAMLPWKGEASSIFALDKDNKNPPPELVIQDELHLISGALGSMVGLYEAAIDLLCSRDGRRPKIVASTATIRRAAEQCRAIYARRVQQFPPPGIDAADSFFASEADVSSDKPGRLYVGVMPSGKTSTTTQVRLMADCLQGVAATSGGDHVKDKFWTQVVYCNSIRELGKTKAIAYDDVDEYLQKALCMRLGIKPRYYRDSAVEELTGRIPAESIPEVLQALEVPFPEEKAIHILTATSMISVGVDVDRLGLMIIVGQPKTTSEYIQASSRVGRKYPGIVFTLYSPTKSRDRSHYEQFRTYHQAIYSHVEPTSVTPFSPPARDKALHAALIILLRHLAGLHENSDASSFDPESEDIRKVVGMLAERARGADPGEAESVMQELEGILKKITEVTANPSGATFVPVAGEKAALMRAPSGEGKGEFVTQQSMRSTDAECYIRILYREAK